MKNPVPPASKAPLFHRINPTLERLGISRTTLYRLVDAGELDLVKIGPQASAIPHESLARFCASRGVTI